MVRFPYSHRGRLCGPPQLRPHGHRPGAGGGGLPGGNFVPAGLAQRPGLQSHGPPPAGGDDRLREPGLHGGPLHRRQEAAQRGLLLPRQKGGPAPGPGGDSLCQPGQGGLPRPAHNHRRPGGLPPPLCPLRLLGGQGAPQRPGGCRGGPAGLRHGGIRQRRDSKAAEKEAASLLHDRHPGHRLHGLRALGMQVRQCHRPLL